MCRDQRAARSFPILRRPMQSQIQWPPKLIFHACPLVSNVVCGPCSKQYHLIIGHEQSSRALLGGYIVHGAKTVNLSCNIRFLVESSGGAEDTTTLLVASAWPRLLLLK